MENNTSISATKISSFLNNFHVYGVNIDDILNHAHLNPSILSSPDNRLSGFEAEKIIRSAAELSKDEYLGLHQGERLSKGFSNILGYILMNCSDLKECSKKYCIYEKIIDGTSISKLDIVNKFAVLSNTTIDIPLKNSRHFSEFKIAGMVSYIKLLCGENISLNEVHFTSPKPENIYEYERIFKCKIYFEKEENALIFDSKFLNIPVIEPNEKLLFLFEKNAQEFLEALDDKKIYTNKVTKIILEEIKNCTSPSIEVVAKKLLISVRTLQLNLQKEDTSYIKLLNELRKISAKSFLKDKNTSVDEIAYILGFSESSSFHRAFKNWTGLTPFQFRNSNFYRE